ncbi:MAG: N-carbamoylputrescine amidase [Gammaproteobacteria bacterium]
MQSVTLAATQMQCGTDRQENLDRAEKLVRQASTQGANIILVQELFETPYFCKDQIAAHFDLATSAGDNPAIRRMSEIAAELGVVLPVSFFERANNAFFNSLVVIDADGRVLDIYRKSHIPDGPGYQEKFYFSPGDTGFRVWDTRFGRIGVAICWDQWFPEAARIMALQGAEYLFYPTAIGSEPQDASLDSRDHWQRTMQGHAAANTVPVVASNRIGTEQGKSCAITFYGSSFITDHTGAKLVEAERDQEQVLVASFDRERLREIRASWGLFRDRRPDLYYQLLSMDGGNR